MFQQITILGPGLLGASLAMAIRENSLAEQIVIWARSPESREQCRQQGWCDATFATPQEAVADSDLVLLCTPVNTIVSLLEKIQPALKKDALVSDVGSTKALICNKAHQLFQETSATFLGAHPMAGSDQTGMENARPDLFKGAACILTPLPDSQISTNQQLTTFWKSLGTRVTVVTPETHDAIVAHISHLPHILASALCSYLAQKDSSWQSLAGGGLKDTTRIAAGDPDLWKQILEQNRNEILQAIDGFEQQLNVLKTALTKNDPQEIHSQLEQGKVYRDQLT